MLLFFSDFCLVVCFSLFFFFKQKTAYELRISDWSSDVCSSDLRNAAGRRHGRNAYGSGKDRRRPVPAFATPCRAHANPFPHRTTADASRNGFPATTY